MPTINIFLSFLAFFFGSVGIYLTLRAFCTPSEIDLQGERKHSKVLLKGCIGVFFIFFSGVFIIYFYSLLPISERIKNENKTDLNEELPDISIKLDFNNSKNTFNPDQILL